ncbi:MAG TPA: methyltransferase domain-containing protein [Candidatus Dormibacteraeota bacterium]|nr:methyltransferase domain-containing protein [Candidatus Dormibacteraeota bacterium]
MAAGHECGLCGRRFPSSAAQRDFRLRAGDEIRYEVRYTPLVYDAAIDVPLQCEAPCPEPRNRLRGDIPVHLTAAQVSYIPETTRGGIALDLGCGHGIHRSVLERLGYRYFGADYSGPAAQDLVDAHALPYADQWFDLVLSVAVIEHLSHPYRALAEVHRVLKPGMCFIGTAAFLEPFHDNSFAHLSHLGLWQALRTSGFIVDAIMPIAGWHAVRAQVEMGFGARLPGWVTSGVSRPFGWAIESYAALGRMLNRHSDRHRRELVRARHAGAFFFAARREPAAC